MTFMPPLEVLRPVNDPELPAYTEYMGFGSIKRVDTVAQWGAYFQQVILRNNSLEVVGYTVNVDGDMITLPPQSERAVSGWGNYLQVRDLNNDVSAEFSLVKIEEARRRR